MKDAKPSAAVNVTTAYGYDKDGNLTTVTDPNGHATAYTFDKAGRPLTETNAVGNTTRYSYTASGRAASVTNGAGQTTRLTYDKRGDLTRQDLAGQAATFEYDRNQNLIAMVDPTGTTGFIYDKNGRQTTQIDQAGGRLSSTFDKASQLTSLKLPTGQTLGYTYDKAGRVTSQSSPWGALTYGWDAASNLTELARSTGVTTSYGYDSTDRVTSILHQTPEPTDVEPTATPTPLPVVSRQANGCTTVAAYLGERSNPGAGANKQCKMTNAYLGDRTLPVPANPVPDGGSLEYRYAYNADGSVTRADRTIMEPAIVGLPTSTDAAPADTSVAPAAPKATTRSMAYKYDALDRLTASTNSTGEKNSYGYDAAGNRTSWKRTGTASSDFTQSASFSNANQLTRTDTTGANAGIASYGYDGAGNRTAQSVGGTGTSFSYDPTGRTTSVDRNGRSTTYAYDGLGRQASSTDTTEYGSSTTRTVSAGLAPVQQSDDRHGTTTLVRDAAGNLAAHVTGAGVATWDLLDGLGSTVAGATGSSITQLASYSDWGVQEFATDGWSSPEGYTGEASDATQGLNHYYARSYDPSAATWTAPDTYRGLLASPQTLARYAYVGNNPTTYIDVLGNLCAKRGPGDALPLGCGAPPVQAYNNVTMPPPAPPYVPKKADPKPKGPNDKNLESAKHSQWDSMVINWNKTWKNVGPNWDKTWANFFDTPQARTWDPFLKWVGEHAGMTGMYCGVLLCVQIGSDGFGIGPAVGAGASISAGASTGGLSGLGVSVGCWAADGVGAYASYSRDWEGRQSPDVGITTGAGAGCSGLIMWYW
ncbi:RHS repeat-associated core domain-containing protein [Leifsonia sp. NPDC058292]|uniref:RHS repeat-associated core domain-containing protein n=1 Tax=Leifsonia sp. NPDC058292 TaxID=3346428 RepID=UPI0036DB26E1